MRCRFCGRLLTDPASIEAGHGPECAAKTETPRSRRLDAIARIIDAKGPRSDFAKRILHRMEHGQALTTSMVRFCRDFAADRPAPGDADYVCVCDQAADGSHQAHCLRSQRARPQPVEAA